MEMFPVQSSNLAAVGYDLDTATLVVQFLNGTAYQYSGVPEHEFAGLMGSASKGTYFNQNIKRAGYPYVRIG